MKLAFRMTAISVGFVIAVLSAEIMVRLFLPLYDPSGMFWTKAYPSGLMLGPKNTKSIQWNNKGDYRVSVDTNRYGFRDAKDLATSTADDWFVIGDSFAFGMGIEQNERFSDLLEQRTGKHFFNISVPGANILTYQKLVRYAQENGATIRKLIVCVCMENDLDQYDLAPATGYEEVGVETRLIELKFWLMRHSALYNLVTSALISEPHLRALARKMGLILDPYRLLGNNLPDERMMQSIFQEISLISDAPAQWILMVPSRGLWAGPLKKDEQDIHDRFRAYYEKLGIPVIDPRGVFERNGDPLSYYFKNDPHWNKSGHEIIADEVYRSMKEQGLIQ